MSLNGSPVVLTDQQQQQQQQLQLKQQQRQQVKGVKLVTKSHSNIIATDDIAVNCLTQSKNMPL